jgi:FkbM family methyltransferase
MLRIVNEHVLGDLVARPLRRRLIELERAESERAEAVARAKALGNSVAEMNEAVAERELLTERLKDRIRELTDQAAEREEKDRREIDEATRLAADREAQVRLLRRRLEVLQTSATFQVGRAVVDGVRHPARAVVSVPRDLARVWRQRKSRTARSTAGPTADLVVPIALPRVDAAGGARRLLTMTAPANLLVPRKLAKEGLAGYEASSLACYLSAIKVAGRGAVLDVGSNVGIYAALASTLTSRNVVAFEPTPSLVDVSRRFAGENGLAFRTESMALGAANGSATFYLSNSSDTSNSLAAGFRESSEQIEVPVQTLDDYLATAGLVPAVIKLDTESTEPDVLVGGLKSVAEHRPWILCEVLAGRTEPRLTEIMTPLGYHWYHVADAIPFPESSEIVGDRTYRYLMWLFAPERPGEEFWTALREYLSAFAECTPEAGRSYPGWPPK